MLELRLVFIDRGPAIVLAPALDVDARRIVLEDAPGAFDAVDAAVGSGTRYVVLEPDGAAARGLDQRGIEIATDVLLAPARIIRGHVSLAPLGQPEFWCAHRDEVIEAVTLVNVEVPRDRAQAVCWIQVAVAIQMREAAP